jgi:nitrogen-specific signal transduction histidine kinase
VRDEGPRPPEALTGSLFRPLEQVDDLTGPLLGLSLAHRVADVHAGDLCYDDRDGMPTFTLQLPAEVGCP